MLAVILAAGMVPWRGTRMGESSRGASQRKTPVPPTFGHWDCGLARVMLEFNPVKLMRGANHGAEDRGAWVLGQSCACQEYARLAEREGTTKSDLFRRMVETYKAERLEQEFFALQRKMARRARKMGVLTEEDVERIVFEDR